VRTTLTEDPPIIADFPLGLSNSLSALIAIFYYLPPLTFLPWTAAFALDGLGIGMLGT